MAATLISAIQRKIKNYAVRHAIRSSKPLVVSSGGSVIRVKKSLIFCNQNGI